MEGTVIYGGDFNVAFDTGLGKSRLLGRGFICPTKQSLKVARKIYQQGLVDI